ncbi:hypothetical protein FGO68_gene5246 [Halteria grandinella]|uniref:Uncharacterized protein n=1 Tax=Halteria grandinella TaxID=5974 RepID=A0A8J8SW08_HALGN|nr:hypothetical protein FGO68_gene5246 [Halteria grandinella]
MRLEQFWRQVFSEAERSLEEKLPMQSVKQLFIMPIIMFIEASWAISSQPPWGAPLPPKDIVIAFQQIIICGSYILINKESLLKALLQPTKHSLPNTTNPRSSLSLPLTKRQASYALSMPSQSLPHICLLYLPYEYLRVSGHRDAIHRVACELAVPHPAPVPRQVHQVLVNFICFTLLINLLGKFPDLAGAVGATSGEEGGVFVELAFQDILFRVGFYFLLEGEIFSCIGAATDVDVTGTVTGYKLASVVGYGKGSYSYLILILEVPRCISSQIPYPYPPALVPKYDLHLIRTEHRAIDHDPVVVEVAHVPGRFEVKYLQGAIFRGSEKPLVVTLEAEGGDVARVALVGYLVFM